MRNHKALRYLITPVNVVYSGGRALTGETLHQPTVRAPVGEDAHLGGSWTAGRKPVLFVMIVGETARAANWGLGTYRRQTTPQLAMLDPINFGSVTSCGTNTETSLPCMFSAIGRRDYDETRIRNSESLLHVLARAGLGVAWIDNQSGCKGVCAGLDTYTTLRDADQPHCDGESVSTRSCWTSSTPSQDKRATRSSSCTSSATTDRPTIVVIRRPSSSLPRPAAPAICGAAIPRQS